MTCSQSLKTILVKSKTPDPEIGHVNDEMWTKIIDKMGVALTLIWEIPHFSVQKQSNGKHGLNLSPLKVF